MALLETLLKPLLDAQLEAGIEIGREEEKKEFETWKARQRAAGVEFIEDDDEAEAEGDKLPACDL